jgi:cysteine desulfurase
MGFDEGAAASAIRVSIGPSVTEDEVLRFADAWGAAARKQAARRSL